MDSVEIDSFSARATHKLGHYVYALIDPEKINADSRGIFYVGKGTGQRCFAHSTWAIKSADFPTSRKDHDLKSEQIRSIQGKGKSVRVEIVAHNLPSDESAFQLEAILIKAFNLTNKQSGRNSDDYWCSANQIEEKYGEPINRSELPGTVLLVGLNQSYSEAQNDPKLLKDVTLGDWSVKLERAIKIDLIIGVYHGLMVSFFRTTKDSNGKAVIVETNPTRAKGKHRRFRWEGQIAVDLENQFKHRALADDSAVPLAAKLTVLPSGASYRYLEALNED